MNSHIKSHCMTVERAGIARRPASFGSQLAFDIHVLTTDVSACAYGLAREFTATD